MLNLFNRPGPTPLVWKYGIWIILGVLLLHIALFWAWNRVNVEQIGFRGTGMQVMTPKDKVNFVPPLNPLPEPGTELAGSMYQELHIPAVAAMDGDTFNAFMQQITDWVSPAEGCYYCHVAEGLEFEAPYTKIVSRRMIEMVQELNSNEKWKNHLLESKVTCYTCHRGNAIPNWVWYTEPENQRTGLGNDFGQNKSSAPGMTAMQRDPYTPYLLDMEDPRAIRVMGSTPLTEKGKVGQGATMRKTELTYSLMMSISAGTGANCTYCHNTQNFNAWNLSREQRVRGWEGMNMVRDLNRDWLLPLQSDFTTAWVAQTNTQFNDTFHWEFGSDKTGLARLGPTGDAPKANCGTCHNGEPIPLNRADLTETFPFLQGPPVPRLK